MLKHLSSRSESRNSYIGDLDESYFDDETSLHQTPEEAENKDNATLELPTKKTKTTDPAPEDGITILLTKPTIRKIIERRKSELFLKETLNATIKESEKIAENKPPDNTPDETMEEIQQERSVITIHRRKREPNSDTSSESGIASQVSDQCDKQPEEEKQIFKIPQKDFWKLEDDALPPPPKGFSSPKKTLSELKAERKAIHLSQDFLNHKSNYSYDKVEVSETQNLEAPFGYSTLGGRVRKKKHNTEYGRTPRVELDRMTPRTHHIGRSITMDRRGNHINEKPIAPKYRRPHSVGADLLRYKSGHNFNVTSNALLMPSEFNNSLENFNRADKHRGSSYSISAGSSVSNIMPATARSLGFESSVSNLIANSNTDCPCGTLGRRGILEKINEEIEHKNEAFIASKEHSEACRRKCNYFTIGMIILAILSCLIGGILHHFIGHYPQKLTLNQGDIKLLDVSPFFCGSIVSRSERTNVGILVFDNNRPPKLLSYKRSEDIKISPLQIWKRTFYLLKGSSIKIQLSVVRSVDILFFKTEHKYEVWSGRKQSESYFQKQVCCSNVNNRKGELLLTADEDETYVIAIYSAEEVFPVDVDIHLTFNRTSYDLSHTTTSCVARIHASCSADYGFNTGDKVAIEAPLDGDTLNHISAAEEVEWNCEARVWLYVVVFSATCLCLLVTILSFYFVTTRYLIQSKICCCVEADVDKKHKHSLVEYYDNFGKTNSDIGASENMYDNHSEKMSSIPSGTSDLKCMHGNGSIATMSESSKYIANLFESKGSTSPRLPRPSSTNNNNIASIYNEVPTFVETADSGISVDPESSPTGQSNVNAHNLMQLQEMQYQQLKTLRQRQYQEMQLVDGATAKHLLYRPDSAATLLSHHFDQLSYDVLQRRQDAINRGFSSNYNLNNIQTMQLPTMKRPQSVMSEGDYYMYATRMAPANHNVIRGNSSSHDLTFDNRQIYI